MYSPLRSMNSPATDRELAGFIAPGTSSPLLSGSEVQLDGCWLPQDVSATTASLGIPCHAGHGGLQVLRLVGLLIAFLSRQLTQYPLIL